MKLHRYVVVGINFKHTFLLVEIEFRLVMRTLGVFSTNFFFTFKFVQFNATLKKETLNVLHYVFFFMSMPHTIIHISSDISSRLPCEWPTNKKVILINFKCTSFSYLFIT